MRILELVRQDIRYIHQKIQELKNQDFYCEQKDTQNSKQHLINTMNGELTRLNAILKSGIIPNSYFSSITNRQHFATPEELEFQRLESENHLSFCNKISRKTGSVSNSRFTLFHSDGEQLAQFSIEHNRNKVYPAGGISEKVKKAFIPEEQEPKFAVKVFKLGLFNNNIKNQLRLGLRGAFCYRILGREGFAFSNNYKQYIVSEWLNGDTLDKIDAKEILKLTIQQRIKLALSLITELNILHLHGIVHNDIKPENVMFDQNDFALKLFDFDSVRLEEEVVPDLSGKAYGFKHIKELIYTVKYLEPDVLSAIVNNEEQAYLYLNKQTDIYALGLTLVKLFPDLLIKENEQKVIRGPFKKHTYNGFRISKNIENDYCPELTDLLYSLISPNKQERPQSVNDIFNRFLDILNNSYHDNYNNTHNHDVLDAYADLTTGKVAFDDIESELISYERRCIEAEKVMDRASLRMG